MRGGKELCEPGGAIDACRRDGFRISDHIEHAAERNEEVLKLEGQCSQRWKMTRTEACRTVMVFGRFRTACARVRQKAWELCLAPRIMGIATFPG